jgi:hypothetical protein
MEIHDRQQTPSGFSHPLGIILGVFGVSIWPLYCLGVTEGYSGRSRSVLRNSRNSLVCGRPNVRTERLSSISWQVSQSSCR